MSEEGRRIDPQDWQAFRRDADGFLGVCIERLAHARELPWVPAPDDMLDTVSLAECEDPLPLDRLLNEISENIMPYATGNTHPRFFGWVHGTGTAAGVLAEMAAATMNANLGGRDHGAMRVEAAVIEWLLKVADFPAQASGILTTGTSQATILALSAARTKLFGPKVRQEGIASLPKMAVYVADGAHNCIKKALEVMGHGANALRTIPVDAAGAMDTKALLQALEEDRQNGIQPLAVTGTAGSVNLGAFDPLEELARICAEQDIWLHVDAAFGFWTRIADAPYRQLSKGLEQANSVALDFHKWLSVPYDCGACLISDRDVHYAAFAARPDYLAPAAEGLAGGENWYCDYGLELSRGFRALKAWATVKSAGTRALGDYVTDNCKQAALMGQLVEASEKLRLARPVYSNVCVFEPLGANPAEIAARLQLEGESVFSTTRVDGVECLRAAIVNHRTTSDDIRRAVASVEAAM